MHCTVHAELQNFCNGMSECVGVISTGNLITRNIIYFAELTRGT